ncbi:MAG: hypothetical protein DDT26_02513 [Dehalococcoidia bacterium]|nr:hypothetical protein [Chloroflexota bacterium]
MRSIKGPLAVVVSIVVVGGVLHLMSLRQEMSISGNAGDAAAVVAPKVPEVPMGTSSLPAVIPETSGKEMSLRASIRENAQRASREFRDPVSPALRSPDGRIDPLQCFPLEGHQCQQSDPMVAASWDEAQWMRSRGFLDAQQIERAKAWTDAELDDRYRNGDPSAVIELARRFEESGESLAARKVLADAVRGGNVFAAHQLASIDSGRATPHYSRPGLEWMFVARQLGDGRVTMSYIIARYPNLQPAEIDQAMTVAERLSERLNLGNRVIERRPGRR